MSGHVQDISAAHDALGITNRYQAKEGSILEITPYDLAGPLILTEQLSGCIAERVETLNNAHLNVMIADMRTACQEGVAPVRVFVDQEFLESSDVDLTFVRLDLAAHLRNLVHSYQQRQRIRRGSATRGNRGRLHRCPHRKAK